MKKKRALTFWGLTEFDEKLLIVKPLNYFNCIHSLTHTHTHIINLCQHSLSHRLLKTSKGDQH